MSAAETNHNLEEKLDFLRRHSAGQKLHSGSTLLMHLLNTRTLLEIWGARRALCDAGLFHSVYGTETFRDNIIGLDFRKSVASVIGEEGEELAFLYGIKKNSTFCAIISEMRIPDPGTDEKDRIFAPRLQNRLTGQEISVTRAQMIDLVNIVIANWVEQTPRIERAVTQSDYFFFMMLRPFALQGAQRAIDYLFSAQAFSNNKRQKANS